MQPVTVAVVDVNLEKRAQLERLLQRDDQNIKVLTDIASNYERAVERRKKPRTNLTLIDGVVARIKRLKPRVLLTNTQQFSEAFGDLLIAIRKHCPDTLVVLLVDESVEENQILKALANGARGFLNYGADSLVFGKAVCAVDQGEAWVPRKMLGKIMDKILYTSHRDITEVKFDSAC